MTSILTCYAHPDCQLHNPPPDPGYAPRRLKVVEPALQQIPALAWSLKATFDHTDALRVHTDEYLNIVLAARKSPQLLGTDAWAVSGTADALRAATGLVTSATRDVAAEKTQRAFCLISPGGHHAEAEMAMGFCFINHVAVGAALAQTLGFPRVAVVDIDVHHGNGTQAMFWNHSTRLFVSMHEDGPSGHAHETGFADNILNIPLPHKMDGAAYLKIFSEKVIPKLNAFKPDFIFVSTGFDACEGDLLGQLNLQPQDFAPLGQQLANAANCLCGGRLVAVMEGGYNLSTLGDCASAFVSGLMAA